VSPSQSSGCFRQVFSQEAEDIATIEDPDANFGVQLCHLAQLAVLHSDELLTKRRQLEEQIVLAQVEIRAEGARRLTIRAPCEDELHGLVFPEDLVVVEQFGKQ